MPQPMPANAPWILLVFGTLIAAIVGVWVGVIVRLALGLPVLPREKPRIVPWGGLSVVAAVLAWFAILVTIPAVYRLAEAGAAAAKPRGERPATSPGELMTLSALQNAATLLILPLLLAATSGATGRDFGIGLAGLGRRALQGALTYPLIAPLVFGVMGLCVVLMGRNPHPLESAMQLDRSAGMVAILVVAGVVLAPFAEELIFRGILLGWLTKVALGVRKPKQAGGPELGEMIPSIAESEPAAEVFDMPETATELDDRPSPAPAGDDLDPYAPPLAPADPTPPATRSKALPLALANVAVSIIFAGLHAAVWPTPIPIFFLSLGLGVLYQQTGSIVGPVVLHMIFNGMSTLIMFLALSANPAPAPPGEKPKAVDPIPPPARIVATPSARTLACRD